MTARSRAVCIFGREDDALADRLTGPSTEARFSFPIGDFIGCRGAASWVSGIPNGSLKIDFFRCTSRV